VGLGVVWSGSVMRHRAFMGEVSAHVDEYEVAAAKIAAQNPDTRQVLPALAALEQASLVYDQQDHPWLTSLGLYDVRVDGKADEAYRHKLVSDLLPRLITSMEGELEKGYEGRDLYDTFRIYMMFQKTDRMEIPRVREWFVTHWENTLRGEGTRRKELEHHLNNLLKQVPPPSTLNARLVKDTRALILREPVAQRVYSRVRSNPLYNRKVDLLTAFGAPVRTSFKVDSDVQRALFIPVMFTKDGYDSIDLSPSSALVKDIVNERWVLTDDENAKLDFITEDLDDISKQVKDLYLSEYIQVWDEVYKRLTITEFRNLRHAEEVLANLVDPVYSPLASILQVGQRNTQLRPSQEEVEDLAAKNPKKGGRVAQVATSALINQYEGTPVDKHFRDLNALVAEGRGDMAPVATILNKLQGLKDFMTDISISPEPGQQAFNHARARFDTSAGNAITDVRAYSQSLPEPVRQWLASLADQSWKVLLDSARGYVNNEWRAQVHRPYSQTLQGRYPLNRSSNDEMALYDFSEFFKPGGTVDAFFTEFMAPFVTTRGALRNRVVDNYTLGFSEEVLRQVSNARAIKDIFYRESPDNIAVTMELRPRAMDERDARFTLDVGDERLTYNHGPKFWKTVRWEANQSNMRVRMVFEDLQGTQYERSFQGGWAWFRLLDSSYVEKTSQSNIYLVTFSAGDDRAGGQRDAHKITYEVKTKSADSPLRREVLSAFRAPESIVP
jgi:type VI secretion system protein ImpL